MTFSETCIFQVNPKKVDEFQELMREVIPYLKTIDGVLSVNFIKRTHTIKDFSQIKEGLPPHEITKIVKSVKYVLHWTFTSEEKYGLAQQKLYETYWKAMDKLLIVPHDKYLGIELFK